MTPENKERLIVETIPAIVAIATIGLIEWKALVEGIDGTMLALSYVLVGGLGGYTFKKIKDFIVD